jgi:hypothetical protein
VDPRVKPEEDGGEVGTPRRTTVGFEDDAGEFEADDREVEADDGEVCAPRLTEKKFAPREWQR